ncbi:MAG: hypothetical protein ACP5KN_21485 [Armatimonadota bacterium]
MRAIDPALTAAQAQRGARHTAGVTIGGADYSHRLIGFTYRERAMRPITSTVYLDNTDGALTSSPPTRGASVDLERGCYVGATAYKAELPRLWIEEVIYDKGSVLLTCLDAWGRLSRFRTDQQYNWNGTTDISEIIDWILGRVGLIRSGSVTPITPAFGIPPNTPLDAALKELIARIPEHPYAGLNGSLNFKILGDSDPTVYTYGWNTHHPVLDATYVLGLAKFNTVTVCGADDPYGNPYTYTATDSTQVALAGKREIIINDPTLTTQSDCEKRAHGELDYYVAIATTVEVRTLPVHGLETFDVITLATTPWGGTNYTARVAGYTERHMPGHVDQVIIPGSYVAKGIHTTEDSRTYSLSFVPTQS